MTAHMRPVQERSHDRNWCARAVTDLRIEQGRAGTTPLMQLDLPALGGVRLHIKDESRQPTGSLKHRLARALFQHAICSGLIGPDTPIIEASSGSTAVSEAYFARLLGLRFIAVMPRSTSGEKIRQIEHYGGACEFVDDPAEVQPRAAALAARTGGHFMDQFTNAAQAVDWQGDDNIAASIFAQLAQGADPDPAWIVTGAGTGGTLATLGRYVRSRGLSTHLCLADPEGSVFHRHFADPLITRINGACTLIEGIGRPVLGESFIPQLVDRALAVPDAASCAAARVLSDLIGRRCGGSTGTAFWCAAQLAAELIARGQDGAIVFLLCDDGARYAETYFDDAWLRGKGLDIAPYQERLERFIETGFMAGMDGVRPAVRPGECTRPANDR